MTAKHLVNQLDEAGDYAYPDNQLFRSAARCIEGLLKRVELVTAQRAAMEDEIVGYVASTTADKLTIAELRSQLHEVLGLDEPSEPDENAIVFPP